MQQDPPSPLLLPESFLKQNESVLQRKSELDHENVSYFLSCFEACKASRQIVIGLLLEIAQIGLGTTQFCLSRSFIFLESMPRLGSALSDKVKNIHSDDQPSSSVLSIDPSLRLFDD